MTVYEGRAITKKEGLGTARDYYVREGGAAINELGFHRRLKDFIGWELPMAPRFNDVTARSIWRRFSPSLCGAEAGLGQDSGPLSHMARDPGCGAQDGRIPPRA